MRHRTVCFRSSPQYLPDTVLPMPFPRSLTTTPFERSSTGRFETCSCKPASGGHLPSSIQHHELALVFVTHTTACPCASGASPPADDGTCTPWSRPAPVPAPDRCHKLPHPRRIVQRFFRSGVGQVEPLLQKVNPQHPLRPHRRPPIPHLGIRRFERTTPRYGVSLSLRFSFSGLGETHILLGTLFGGYVRVGDTETDKAG
jgi:hypothetical protein